MVKYIQSLALLFVISSASAQYGNLKGHISHKRLKDDIAFAIVQIEGIKKSAISDANGNFFLDSIPIGTYKIRLHSLEFGDSTYSDIRIFADSTTSVEFTLPSPCSYDLHEHDKKCPTCGKRKHVIPIVYGLPVGGMDNKKYYYAGCQVTRCDPNWYCTKDKTKF